MIERLAQCLLVCSALVPAVSVHAQEAPRQSPGAETASGLEDIVVTARRRAESQQSVPIAVSALSGDAITRKGITDFVQLSRQTPNVIIAGASTNPQLLTIGIRGIRQKEGHIAFENSASIVYNQTVLAHPYGVGEMLYDLADVQILKGPQGTLFGRNSTAGALVVTPRLASVEDGLSGSLTGSLGSYDLRRLTAVLNVPLGEKLAFRIAGEHREREGYVTNIKNGSKWNGTNNDSFRASLTFDGGGVRNYLSGDYFNQRTTPAAIVLVDFLEGGAGSLLGGPGNTRKLLAEQRARGPWKMVSEFATGSDLDLYRPSRCAAGGATPFQSECISKLNDAFKMTVWGVNNRTEIDLGDNATLKNIVAYRAHKRVTFQSSWNAGTLIGASGAGNQSLTGSDDWVKVFTEELNLTGKAIDGRLDYSVGAFFMDDRGTESNRSFQVIGTGGAATVMESIAPTWIKTQAFGLYGQATFAVTDRFNVTGGIRYNKDKKKAENYNYLRDNATGAITCALFEGANRLPNNVGQCVIYGDKSWDAITWTASADYKVFDRAMVYASVSRGYRAGSFFPRAIRASLLDYDPEYVTSYEAGFKADWDLGRVPVRTNLAVYRADVDDMQVQVQDVTTVPLSGFINNAGKARYQGGEFELTVRPTDEFTLNAFASYTDFKYLSYFDGVNDLSYQTAPNPISHWVVGGSANYTIPLEGESTIDLRGDVTWTSKQVTNNILPNAKGDWPQPAYTIVNLRAEWNKLMNSPISAAVWVTNLTKDFYSTGGTCLAGICSVVPSAPRMWGVDLSYAF